MPELYLRCKEKNCDAEFPSHIVMDKKSFETAILVSNYHTCPKGHTHKYNKEDYFFK
jgi:hypothetical protein